MSFAELVALAAKVLEGLGVATIVGGTAIVGVITAWIVARTRDWAAGYRNIRERTGRVILIGLELLVGADIIRTVAEEPTLHSVAVLAGIVLIRTFLSFTITVELEARWPWQPRETSG